MVPGKSIILANIILSRDHYIESHCVIDECADELNVEVDDSNTGDEDFASRALNTLTGA